MTFGVSMFPTDYAIDVTRLGRAVEERGFESLFFPEHTHIPVSRRSPWPGGPDLPEHYRHTLDPFAALAAVAAVTDRIRLGTGICLVAQRDPITLAKEVATVDLLSKGRFLFGIGGGWNREETGDHGTDPKLRFRVLRERVLAMQTIWATEAAEFHGEFVDFDPIWQWPKPVQQPRPPVLVAGNGTGTIDRVLEYGDGWLPMPNRGPVSLREGMSELRRRSEAAGRAMPPVTVFGIEPDASVIEDFVAAGVDRCLFRVSSGSEDEVLRELDERAKVITQFS
jgi:probable F420-dependent oxidoreductase